VCPLELLSWRPIGRVKKPPELTLLRKAASSRMLGWTDSLGVGPVSIHESRPLADRPSTRAPVTMPLQIAVSRMGNRALVFVAGELDKASAPYLRQRLLDLIREGDGDIVLNIGLLTFVDSTGLALFLTTHKNLQSRGCSLILFSPTPSTSRLLEVSGLTEFICIQPSPASRLA
jgi:anti-anti-sigma factor